jgi:dynein heavy chain, axonemal
LEKLKLEMNKCFDVYKILEGFNYRFSKEDLDRRWNVYGGIRDIMNLIEKRNKELEKDKERFLE